MPPSEEKLPVTIDHRFFPHIIDLIISYLDEATLWSGWRATCRANRDRIERAAFYTYDLSLPDWLDFGFKWLQFPHFPTAAHWMKLGNNHGPYLDVAKATVARCLAHTRAVVWVSDSQMPVREPEVPFDFDDHMKRALLDALKDAQVIQAHTNGTGLDRCAVQVDTCVNVVELWMCPSHFTVCPRNFYLANVIKDGIPPATKHVVFSVKYHPDDQYIHRVWWGPELYRSLSTTIVDSVVVLIRPMAHAPRRCCFDGADLTFTNWPDRMFNADWDETDDEYGGDAYRIPTPFVQAYRSPSPLGQLIKAASIVLCRGGTLTFVSSDDALRKFASDITLPLEPPTTQLDESASCHPSLNDNKIEKLLASDEFVPTAIVEAYNSFRNESLFDNPKEARQRIRFISPEQYRDEVGEETYRLHSEYRPSAPLTIQNHLCL